MYILPYGMQTATAGLLSTLPATKGNSRLSVSAGQLMWTDRWRANIQGSRGLETDISFIDDALATATMQSA